MECRLWLIRASAFLDGGRGLPGKWKSDWAHFPRMNLKFKGFWGRGFQDFGLVPAHKPSSATVLEAKIICRAHTLHMLGCKEAVERLRRSESLPSANQDEIHSI